MLESSLLYKRWISRLKRFNSEPGLALSFEALQKTVAEQAKIIVRVFPEYTPHDATRHLEHLFTLSDRVLGANLYRRLNVAELSLFVFGLYAHDWGMAVSEDERAAISGVESSHQQLVMPEENRDFLRFQEEAARVGQSDSQTWESYLRLTHAARSGWRLRKELLPLGQQFAEMVARVAEGHVLDTREIRDPHLYPLQTALFGQIANVAAVAAYVRMIDLLDIAEDRTPFALWSIIRPRNAISATEWGKHRALAPVAVREISGTKKLLIAGTTDKPDIFAALADLRAWVDPQFAESVEFLRNLGKRYDTGLDSTITWDIQTKGFEPVLLRFDLERSAALGLLSKEVYGLNKLTFIRELLQNSVDAIATRTEVLKQTDTQLQGSITVEINTLGNAVHISWIDNGVGMDREILERYFAKIGSSWYQSSDFKKRSLSYDPISRFGIGVLSCFGVSPSVDVTTKREPLLAKDPHGWQLQIPTLDGHFTVKMKDHVAVGTTIRLVINNADANLAASRIAATIRETGALVRVNINLLVDGEREAIAPVSTADDPRLPYTQFNSLDEEALTALQTLTIHFKYHYSSPNGGFEAFFSRLFPRDLSDIRSLEDKEWKLGSGAIDFHDYIVKEPQGLFIRGIATEVDSQRRGFDRNGGPILNILKPSLVQPDLSRSQVDLGGLRLDDFWKELALQLRKAIVPKSDSIDIRVRSLALAHRIGNIPDEFLSDFMSSNEWPVWMLERDSGLVWRDISRVFVSDEILEAPQELQYVSENNFQAVQRVASQWSGPSCFLSLKRYSRFWWGDASRLAHTWLRNRGFNASELRLVNSATDDAVPLACLVWRKTAINSGPKEDFNMFDLLSQWQKNPVLEFPELVRRTLMVRGSSLDDAPLLVRFPKAMEHIAAIGSLYWNQANPKIQALVGMLLELATRSRRHTISGRTQQLFGYINSTSYLGYAVSSRHSNQRVAIDRYNELITAAKTEGLSAPAPLTESDFLPGSVGKYWNPYHYPIGSWQQSPGVGTPWIPSDERR
jgi:Histidine kinase-, DNA gyrase B-, and HSP90-like ATPase